MWINKYTLRSKEFLNSASTQIDRFGFFVKSDSFLPKQNILQNFLQFSEFTYWPELGDPIQKQLKTFLKETVSNELKFSFSIAEANLRPVKSNAIVNAVTSDLGERLEKFQDLGFDVVKFKMGREFQSEYKSLLKVNLSHVQVRIDLNNKFTYKESKEILELLKKIPNLEYIEDPTLYHDYHWSELEKIAPLALDEFNDHSDIKPPRFFQYRIVKPIRGISLEKIIQMTYDKKKIVLTNMMDNIVGAWKMYFYYCELSKHIPYHLSTPGFYTHSLFQNYQYSSLLAFNGSQWNYDGEKLKQLTETLTKLNWTAIDELDSGLSL